MYTPQLRKGELNEAELAQEFAEAQEDLCDFQTLFNLRSIEPAEQHAKLLSIHLPPRLVTQKRDDTEEPPPPPPDEAANNDTQSCGSCDETEDYSLRK